MIDFRVKVLSNKGVKWNVTPTLVGLVKVLKQFYPLKWVLHNLGAKVWFVSLLRTQESKNLGFKVTNLIKAMFLLIAFSSISNAGVLDYFKAQDATKAFDKKEYNKAISNYETLAKEGNQEAIYNLGVSYYKAGKYKEAIEQFKQVKDNKLKFNALYNSGNALAKVKKIDDAIKAYEEALKIKDDKDTKYNLELLKKLKKKQEQKKKQNKKNKKENKKSKQDKKQQQNKQNNQQNKDKKNSKDKQNKNQNQKQQERSKNQEDNKSKEQKKQNQSQKQQNKENNSSKKKQKKEEGRRKKEEENKNKQQQQNSKESNKTKEQKRKQAQNQQQKAQKAKQKEQNKKDAKKLKQMQKNGYIKKVPISDMEERKWRKMLEKRGVNTLMLELPSKGVKNDSKTPW